MRVTVRLKLAVLAAVGGLLILPVAASATEATPLGIAQFAIQTLKGTKEVETTNGVSAQPLYEFVNEPDAFTQAGGHPWALTTTGEFTTEVDENPNAFSKVISPTRDPRDIAVTLPPGLLGDPQAVPRCPLEQVTSGRGPSQCPADTQIGVFV